MVKRIQKKVSFLLVVVLLLGTGWMSIPTSVQAAPESPFAGGEGTTADPYQIETAAQLALMGDYLNKSFKLMNNIDLTAYVADGGEGWNDGEGWVPIGNEETKFIGNFDGQGYTITGLMINRPSADDQGLFGYIGYINGSIIKNMGLIDVNVTGNDFVGGLAGYNSGTITNSFTSGIVEGDEAVGGLVGYNGATTTNSFSSGNVEGRIFAGGLVGNNTGPLSDSYATGEVMGSDYVGGLAGGTTGTTTNVYSTGEVTASEGSIDPSIGGLIGWYNDTSITNSYYDKQSSGQSDTGKGDGKTTAEMKQQDIFVGWDFTTGDWSIEAGSYPRLQSIAAVHQPHAAAPLVVSAVVEDAHPNQVIVTFNEAVAITGKTGVTINVGGIDATVTGAVYDMGTNGITFTINTSIDHGQNVSIDYDTTSGTIADLANNQLLDFTTTVINRVVERVDEVLSASIEGVIAPVTDSAPVLSIENTEYTGTISWTPDDPTFDGDAVYTATVTLTPKEGYTITGVSEDHFTIADAITTNNADSGVVTAVFPATAVSTNATITSTIGVVSTGGSANETITNLPRETTLSVLKSKISKPASASYEVYEADGLTVATALATGQKLIVTAQDGITKVTYVLSVELTPLPVAFAGGTGTVGDPYLISTADQLNELRYFLAEGTYFKQINDIDLTDYPDDDKGWLPISGYETDDYFRGNYDGNGFKIMNLMINRPRLTDEPDKSIKYVGLFGLFSRGTITDVTLENANVIGGYGAASLVGLNFGTIRNSTVSGSVYGTDLVTGGLVGDNYSKIISSSSSASVHGLKYIGGLVGGMQGGTATISSSFATGNVHAEGEGSAGGLVGQIELGTISNSYATGNVSGGGRNGGLVGDNRRPIINSYATGNVSGTSEVGGLVGYNSNSGTIRNSYATGSVYGTTDVGGLVGLNSAVGADEAISHSFYDEQTTNQSDTGKGDNKTTIEMQSDDTYVGWNFLEIWGIDSSRNNGYPYLNVLPSSTIVGVTAPVTGATPTATIAATDEYTATIAWSPGVVNFFAGEEDYTATITLTPKTGYTLTDVPENFYKVAGATTTNSINSGVVSAVFPATAATITTPAINGVTAPVTGATPVATIAATDEYTATIEWSPEIVAFAGEESYTATITLTAKTGYTLTGVGENFFMVAGATATNTANAGVITAVFPITASSRATLTSTIGTVSMGGTVDETITNIPSTTTLVALKAAITPADYATFKVYDSNGTTEATTLATGKKVVVTAQDGITQVTYTVTVRSAPSDSDEDSPPAPPSTNNTVISTDGTITLPTGRIGEVSLEDEVTVTIPADATDKELKLTIEKVLSTESLLSNQEVLVSSVFEILKNFPENFSKSVTLTFIFDSASLKSNQKAAVFYYDEVNRIWVEVGGVVSGNKITVDVDHFTKYAVLVVDEAIEPAPDTPKEVNLSDISGHWAEASIEQAMSDGMVNGYPDGTFKPNDTVTRAEFTVMLMNALKPQGEGVQLTFTDTASIGAWALKSVSQAVQAGIIKGYIDGTFGPNAEITRAEMASMIAIAMGESMETNAAVTGFADDEDIPAWAKAAVAFLKQAGIVQGKGENEFAPQDHATRAEAVTILLNMLGEMSK